MWQIELTLHVAWCSRKTRTRPAHTNAVKPANSEPPDSAKPSDERDREPEQHPEREEAGRRRRISRVLLEVRREAARGGALAVEQPAHVRVPEAGEHAAHALARVGVGAVRVALLVGEGVVLAMVGDPVDHRALDRHRSEDRERGAHPGLRVERAVRQHAMEADRHAEADGRVHHGQDREIESGDEAAPEQVERGEEAEEGDDDGDDRDATLERGGVRMMVGVGHI